MGFTSLVESLVELGGIATLVGVSFYIWNGLLNKKDDLLQQALKEAKEDRNLNRIILTENTNKMAQAHKEGMSEVAHAITYLAKTHGKDTIGTTFHSPNSNDPHKGREPRKRSEERS